MQVFKYYFKILKEYKSFIILYTILLVAFGTINFNTNQSSMNFVATKPDVMIINNDSEVGITKHFSEFIEKNTVLKDLKRDENSLADALFYRDVSYIITIPKGFNDEFMSGKNPLLSIKSAGNYEGEYASMLVDKYMNLAKLYLPHSNSSDDLINKIDSDLKETTKIKIKSKIKNTNEYSKATFYYNFAGYSLLAGSIYVISMILCSFKQINVRKRIIISSIKNKEYNRSLLLGNSAFVITLWLIYAIISIFLVKDAMLSIHGILYLINSFIYVICALAMGFLIGNIANNKESISGIVNVVGLGSAFLCGCFVPAEFLPEFVSSFSKLLPTYWYVQNNELIKTLEVFNYDTLKPFITNSVILIAFIVIFIIVTNMITKKKMKIN